MNLHLFLNLLVAAGCGAALGLEREIHKKPAGLRTNMLIALGSTLFTYSSVAMAGPNGDPSRIAAQIVTGIGFLGAGTIMRHGEDTVTGLTSAATVWVVAAIGVLAGFGHHFLALGSTGLAFLVLWGVGRLETRVGLSHGRQKLQVRVAQREGALHALQQCFLEEGVEIDSLRVETTPENELAVEAVYCTWSRRRARLLDRIARVEGLISVASKPV